MRSLSGTQFIVPSIWSLGSDLVSYVPCLCDAIDVVGEKIKK